VQFPPSFTGATTRLGRIPLGELYLRTGIFGLSSGNCGTLEIPFKRTVAQPPKVMKSVKAGPFPPSQLRARPIGLFIRQSTNLQLGQVALPASAAWFPRFAKTAFVRKLICRSNTGRNLLQVHVTSGLILA
jgi:hypothetical protein